ncbi:MAG TPA: Abi family protein [Thomasclavelia ramosa]|nr:Abi family protein [Thomasclavelia ramosa]
MERFQKQPLNLNQQVELLEERGLIISDKERAKRLLGNISYFRLSAYMLPYKIKTDDKIIDKFEDKINWDDIYRLYLFDRKLRLLVFDAIERIEVSVRAQVISQLSLKYGSHWQDNRDVFKAAHENTLRDGSRVSIDVFSEIQHHINEQLNSNKAEVFIKHYVSKYDEPKNPPSWMCVEIMYFNQLSKICSNLKNRSDINSISQYYALPPDIFCSWLHSINYIRNICAHHARLWNRDMNIVPNKLKFSKKLKWVSDPETTKRGKVYYSLCILNYMLQTVNHTSNFIPRLKKLMSDYKTVINLNSMGFPDKWEQENLWQD